MTRGAKAGRFAAGLAVVAALGLAAGFVLTAPSTLPASALAQDYRPDLANGQTMFDAGGCASCHMTPGQGDRLKLGGGLGLVSPFGTFFAPNLSADPDHGIGRWSELDFVNAVMRGVAPDGEHLYPALPYTSYQRMTVKDVRDLFAYLKTLPAVDNPAKQHQLTFPFNLRRGLGLWKLVYLDGEPFRPDPSRGAAWNRGAYLVEGPGHCAECHSRRDALGGIAAASRFAGGPDPQGKGFVPNITPHQDGLAEWSEAEIADFLKTGLTPAFDSAGGTMAEVIANTSRLSDSDRAAIAVYLKALPARPGKRPPKKS